jgi:energy-coupling factor transporter ATP-binding protein EcfA2
MTTPVLSPKMQGDVLATIEKVAHAGVTLLVAEQNVRGALLISDRALVMERGRKVLDGPAAEAIEVFAAPTSAATSSRRRHRRWARRGWRAMSVPPSPIARRALEPRAAELG